MKGSNNYSINDYMHGLSVGKLLSQDTQAEYALFLNILDADGDGVINDEEENALRDIVSPDHKIGQEDLITFINTNSIGTNEIIFLQIKRLILIEN